MPELEYDFIYTKYWLEDPAWSGTDLAKYYDTYPSKIYRFMIKYDIPIRNRKKAMLNMFKCQSKKDKYLDAINSQSYKERYNNPITKKKLSISQSKRWKEDIDYRDKMMKVLQKVPRGISEWHKNIPHEKKVHGGKHIK